MNGLFHNIDDWLVMVQQNNPREERAQGAEWWLSRVRNKEPSRSF